MAKLEFKDLMFIDEKDRVKVVFLKHFHFFIDKSKLEKIGKFKLNKNFIDFDANKKRANKFYDLIDKGLERDLKSGITGSKAVYIHKGSGIPLIGNSSFGIVDRGTSLVEIKMICGCNLNCVYCSVDQNKRDIDFVIEKDYLIEELRKVIEIKKHDVEVHIGCHGEPLLYSPLIEFVRDMKKIKGVKKISMNTNTTLLTPRIVDKLIDAGMTRFNLSINSLDPKLAKKIAGGGFSVEHAKRIAEYISSKKVDLTIAPVWMCGVNDDDIEDIVVFAKSLNADIGIQNFLYYKFGKKPVKELHMDKFFEKLKALEKKHDKKLILCADDFDIKKDIALAKPFKKGEVIDAIIICCGRLPGEMLAVSQNRTISLYNCDKKTNSRVKIKITRQKHNIFSGVLM
ncbi:radical SAM protein [Candidatus Woesearchaeota archaeon]|nr:radical SAM protein [Candidatus Woesearchaeota archaeon]